MIQNGPTPNEFVAKNKHHRPAGADDWGLSTKGGRLAPPTADELPIRKKKEAEPSDETKSPSLDQFFINITYGDSLIADVLQL